MAPGSGKTNATTTPTLEAPKQFICGKRHSGMISCNWQEWNHAAGSAVGCQPKLCFLRQVSCLRYVANVFTNSTIERNCTWHSKDCIACLKLSIVSISISCRVHKPSHICILDSTNTRKTSKNHGGVTGHGGWGLVSEGIRCKDLLKTAVILTQMDQMAWTQLSKVVPHT